MVQFVICDGSIFPVAPSSVQNPFMSKLVCLLNPHNTQPQVYFVFHVMWLMVALMCKHCWKHLSVIHQYFVFLFYFFFLWAGFYTNDDESLSGFFKSTLCTWKISLEKKPCSEILPGGNLLQLWPLSEIFRQAFGNKALQSILVNSKHLSPTLTNCCLPATTRVWQDLSVRPLLRK